MTVVIEYKAYYPGWAPNSSSDILKVVVAFYKRLFKLEPISCLVHTGLN